MNPLNSSSTLRCGLSAATRTPAGSPSPCCASGTSRAHSGASLHAPEGRSGNREERSSTNTGEPEDTTSIAGHTCGDASVIVSGAAGCEKLIPLEQARDRKSTRLNSSHVEISYAVFCLKKKKRTRRPSSTKTQK